MHADDWRKLTTQVLSREARRHETNEVDKKLDETEEDAGGMAEEVSAVACKGNRAKDTGKRRGTLYWLESP